MSVTMWQVMMCCSTFPTILLSVSSGQPVSQNIGIRSSPSTWCHIPKDRDAVSCKLMVKLIVISSSDDIGFLRMGAVYVQKVGYGTSVCSKC
jgi:hypothetical protein